MSSLNTPNTDSDPLGFPGVGVINIPIFSPSSTLPIETSGNKFPVYNESKSKLSDSVMTIVSPVELILKFV